MLQVWKSMVQFCPRTAFLAPNRQAINAWQQFYTHPTATRAVAAGSSKFLTKVLNIGANNARQKM